MWIFEVRKFELCFCVFIQILESEFTRDLSFFFFKIVYGPKNGLGFFFCLKVEQIILFIYLREFPILIKGDPNFFLRVNKKN